MYKYKGNNPSELLDKSNYPMSYGEGDLEVIFESIQDKHIEWAKDMLVNKVKIKKLNWEVASHSESGMPWHVLFLLECERKTLGVTRKPDPKALKNGAMSVACANNDIDCVKILLSKGASANKGKISPLVKAISNKGDLKLVELLVDNGANYKANNSMALLKSATSHKVDISMYLAKKEGLNGLVQSLEDILAKEEQRKKKAESKEIETKWSKINQSTIMLESFNPENDISLQSIFNFSSSNVNTKIYRFENNQEKTLSEDSVQFSKFQSQSEIQSARQELLNLGGEIPNQTDKSNKSALKILDINKLK